MRRDDSNPSIEHRRWPRVSEMWPVIRCDARDQKCTDYFTRNISGGGAMIEAPEAMPVGTSLRIESYIPMDDEVRTMKCIRLGTQVRWVQEIAGSSGCKWSNRYRMGLSFDQIDSKDQALLEAHVRRRLGKVGAKRLQ